MNGCNRFPDLRAAAARKTLKSLKESTWNTIRTVIKQWGGAVKDEHYHINNVAGTLRFRNDKRDYHARPDRSPLRPRLRAVRLDGGDHCRDEASEVSQKTVEVLFSRLRWKTHETFKVSKMLLTPNPTTNWIRSRFVQNDNGERATCREGGGCVPFSVCDNPDIASRPTYESTLNKISDHATKDRLPYDNWDFVEVNDTAVYNRFDGALHLVTGLRARAYDPSRPPITLVALLPFVSVHIQKKARPEAAPIQT